MEAYSSNNAPSDALRRFFSRYGKALVAGIIIGVGALAGWRYWEGQQESEMKNISAEYQKMVEALKSNHPESLQNASQFVEKNRNIYGALASLELTNQWVISGQLDKAASQLQNGLKATKDVHLQTVMRLRLARIQVQQKQADSALTTLDKIKEDGWSAMKADVRGDALLSKGDKQGAGEAWRQGIASDASSALKEIMQMKINNLA